jgi:glycosyltransferase involved in cell wall biosynthesis
MAQQAKESMLGRFPVLHIPHGVDTEAYQPLDREACRRTLGIPMGKKVMMFLAADLNNKLKGGDLLIDALERLPASLRKEAVLLLLGNGGDKIAKAVDMPSIVLGYVGSDRLKAACYSAADVFVHPSRAEVFGYAVLESMACGTPVVGFRVGGVPDLVRPHVSGVLAEPFDIVQFVGGILEVIEDANHREGMRQRSRQIVKEEYTLDLQIQRYVDLYRQLMAPGLAVTSSVAGTGANASIGAKE